MSSLLLIVVDFLVFLLHARLGEYPLAEMFLLVIGSDIKLVALLCFLDHVLGEGVDVLSIEFWPDQVDLILISDSEEALIGRWAPLNSVDDLVWQAVSPHHLARASVPNYQIMVLVS